MRPNAEAASRLGLVQALGPMTNVLGLAGLSALILLFCSYPLRHSHGRLITFLFSVTFLCFGLFVLSLSADLYSKDEALALSKRAHGHVLRTKNPVYFWFSTIFITTSGTALSVFGAHFLRISFKPRKRRAIDEAFALRGRRDGA